MTEDQVEQEVINRGLSAPRVTVAQIDSLIVDEHYYVFPDTTVTVCLLELRNGFNVTGTSACASIENFDEELGRRIARDDARDKIWMLEGYLLKQRLYESV